jgi:uncharacterized protein with HEPN domain
MRPERLLLTDILSAISLIDSFLSGVTRSDFLADARTQSAVLYQLIVIGEAASRLPSTLRDEYPEVEWGPIVGFRNRVVHGYFAIDWSIVWNAATVNVRTIAPQITAIVNEQFPPQKKSGGPV